MRLAIAAAAVILPLAAVGGPRTNRVTIDPHWFYKQEFSRPIIGQVPGGPHGSRGDHLNVIMDVDHYPAGWEDRCLGYGGRPQVQTVRGVKYKVCVDVDF